MECSERERKASTVAAYRSASSMWATCEDSPKRLAELVAADGEERSLDFHPRAFGSGRCAQTLIHKAGVLVEQRGDDRYLLLVRPSFAAYVAEWLLDGMLGLKADAAA
jgi:hypothetical protein